MKTKHYIITFLVTFMFLFIGAYNVFSFWWSPEFDKPPLRIIISFISLGVAAMGMAYFICGILFVRKNSDIRLFKILFNFDWRDMDKKITDPKIKKIKSSLSVVFMILFLLFGAATFFSLKKFEKYQLSHFGIQQEVTVSETRKSQKGLDLAVIKYTFDHREFSKELFLKDCKIGDKERILFSSKNPLIAIWYKESTR